MEIEFKTAPAVRNFLIKLGCPVHLNGFEYLTHIISKQCDANAYYSDWSITKDVYEYLAHKYGKTPQQVERCIRTCIEACFDNITPDEIERVFGNTISANKGKPMNRQFITIVIQYMLDNELPKDSVRAGIELTELRSKLIDEILCERSPKYAELLKIANKGK